MKAWLAACFTLGLATSAAAQTFGEQHPLGPFVFGMSTEQARAVVHSTNWEVMDDPDLQRGTMRSEAPVVEIGGIPFRARLAYAANAVTFIQLTASVSLSRENCAERHGALVAAEVQVRGAFARSETWHRFYENPDGPTGHLDGDTFVPAPSIVVAGESAIRSRPGQLESVIRTFRAPDYRQEFHEALGQALDISAHSIARDAGMECRLTMTSTHPRGAGGFRPSNGPTGPERLAERLAVAAFVRPMAYLSMPSSRVVTNLYPERALSEELEGDARLDCLALADGLLDCAIAAEAPLDRGFGAAALRAASYYRADVFTGVVGKRTEITMRFRLPD